MPRMPAAAGVALALLVGIACAAAVSPPPFTIADIGSGAAEPANCTFSDDGSGSGGDMEASWLEITGEPAGRWGGPCRQGAPRLMLPD